jgi:hypothetical protein
MAAINIAFVAVECTKSYTNILYKKVFKLPDLIESEFGCLMSVIVDRQSMDTITDLNINGQSISVEIEKCKRGSEKLKAEIEDVKTNLLSTSENQFEFRNFSNSCLWSFLYCVAALFLSGVESTYGNIWISSLFMLSCISFLYFVCGWILGEREFSFVRKRFIKLLFVIGLFISTLVVAFVSGYLIAGADFIDQYKNYLILLSAVIPFLNFIAYFSITYRKIKYVRREIKIKTNDLNEKCKEWSSSADSLINAQKLCSKITAGR